MRSRLRYMSYSNVSDIFRYQSMNSRAVVRQLGFVHTVLRFRDVQIEDTEITGTIGKDDFHHLSIRQHRHDAFHVVITRTNPNDVLFNVSGVLPELLMSTIIDAWAEVCDQRRGAA